MGITYCLDGFYPAAGNLDNHANNSRLQNIATIALYCVLAFRCEIVLPAHKNAVTGLYCAVAA
jgi:hypothetical protein